jgi:hypothetical protein
MQFVVTKQIAVEAETPEEAVARIAEGNTIALSVTLRPQQNPPTQLPPMPPLPSRPQPTKSEKK